MSEFVFFKQKTAYEMCISDWSSDVCSSDLVADRSESFLSDHHARDNLWSVELALDAEHRFIALRSHSRANLGAYLAYAGTHQATNNVGGIAGVYRTPHIAVRIQGVHTNTQPVAPYRGAGRPEDRKSTRLNSSH